MNLTVECCMPCMYHVLITLICNPWRPIFFFTEVCHNGCRHPLQRSIQWMSTSVSFFFLWNECRNPFQDFEKQISRSVSFIFFVFLWNRCRNPFHKFLKRMSTSVSLFFFYLLWNGCRHPFQEFVKQISTSVSFFLPLRMSTFALEIPETDVDIRFLFFWVKSSRGPHFCNEISNKELAISEDGLGI